MKTVLCIDSAGMHYFQRVAGHWRSVEGPAHKDTLWVLVNLPDESLEVVTLPRLYGSDRRNYLERRLSGAFPGSIYRIAHILSGGLLNPCQVMLTGLTSAQAIVDRLISLDTSIVGLWGVSSLLSMMAKRLVTPDAMVVLPGTLALRILVIKNRVPVLTRHVVCDDQSCADEILLTRNYLKNEEIFEGSRSLPVLYLGDASSFEERFNNAGLHLISVPKGFSPQGEVGWMYSIFNHLVSSPPCQLLPLSMRASYLARNIRWAAYAGAALSLGVGSYLGQADMRALRALHERAHSLQSEVQRAVGERQRLAGLIKRSGFDPKVVRHVTQFESQELAGVPSGEAFLPLAAEAIAAVPEARIQMLAFHLAAQGASVCGDQKDVLRKDAYVGAAATNSGVGAATASSLRQAEVQLTVMFPGDFSLYAKKEARKQISAKIRSMPGVTLLGDPVFAARKAVIKSGSEIDTSSALDRWCLSVSWKENTGKSPAGEEGGAL